MKNLSPISKLILVGAATTLAAWLPAHAQFLTQVNGGNPIEGIGTIPNTSNGPANDGGTTGTDGYYFFHDEDRDGSNPIADVSALPTYVSSVTAASGTGGFVSDAPTVGYLTISGHDYSPGRVYTFGTTLQPLAQINLTGTVPRDFDIGFLQDNYSFNGPDGTRLTLELFNPTVSTTMPISTVAINTTSSGNEPTSNGSTNADDFYYGEVTRASAGDYLLVLGANSSTTNANFVGALGTGGFTFDTVPTPEPSTYALMLAGLGLLAHRAHRARRSA